MLVELHLLYITNINIISYITCFLLFDSRKQIFYFYWDGGMSLYIQDKKMCYLSLSCKYPSLS